MTGHPDRVGYCTNVHAGVDMAAIRQTLLTHAAWIAAHRRSSGVSDQPLPVGLWIPASAAGEMIAGDGVEQFADWMVQHDLTPLTINGFPYDNFHLPVVKHRVYRPAWWETARLDYTVQLAELLDRLMSRVTPHGGSEQPAIGSISTLPLGWPGRLGLSEGSLATGSGIDNVARAGANLRLLADRLHELEQRTGRRMVVAIEPEPGCLLDRYDDIVGFFAKELPEANHRRHLTVCHDICHSAVMFESQSKAIAAYAKAGITIGKVQVSSAIDLPLAAMTDSQRRAAIGELFSFAEDRYLHQTGVVDQAGEFRLVEDLPQWLEGITLRQSAGQLGNDHHLRIHFHVPIYRQSLGHLQSTQEAIVECLAAIRSPEAPEFTGHYEVETYAWTVLPEQITAGSLTPQTLAEGIATELAWFESLLAAPPTLTQNPTGPNAR